ncbi:hypothetical protein DFH06DRAFT_1073348 [Mycena polygramma]|nr:hypothetical protein DFH06DRAFT_1073348 [Mycena polygramma]
MGDSLVFPFTKLPFDICEQILGRVDSRRDLVSFAAASTACKVLVIPTHTEYRTLCVGNRPEVWAHLAQRPDLAGNIRAVTIRNAPAWNFAFEKPERHPVTLLDQSIAPETVGANICLALRSMDSLCSFTWVAAWSPADTSTVTHDSDYHSAVFQTLKDSKSLVRLTMVDMGTIDSGPAEAEEYPLWHIANLQALCLRQINWWPKGLNSLLLRSSNLQDLDIDLTLTAPVLASCCFPQLRTLNLNTTSGTGEQTIVEFLQRHPTIERLRWYPSNDTLRFSPGSLPNLRCLVTSTGIAPCILSDRTVPERALECISQISLNEQTWVILDAIDTSRLRDLRVWRYAGLETINHLAARFPRLTHLEIPKFGLPTRDDAENAYTIDDYIHTLSKFTSLECLIDSSIWPVLRLGGDGKIASLATRCPSLQRLGYFNQETANFVDIVLIRNDGKVSWKQEMPQRE